MLVRTLSKMMVGNLCVMSNDNYKTLKPHSYVYTIEIMNENMILVLNFLKPHKLWRKTLQVIIDP